MSGVEEKQLAGYRALFQAIEDGVAVFDRHGRMVMVNDAMARLSGAPGAAQILRDFPYYRERYELVTPEGETIPPESWPIAAILRGEAVSERRLTARRRKDGLEMPLRILGAPLFDSQGRLEAGVIILRRLDGRNQDEEERSRNERKYRDLLENLDDGFCVIQMVFDEEGNAIDYHWLETNATFEKQTGLKDAVGKNVRTLVPDLDESWFRLYGGVALTGESIRFENYAPAMDRWFDVYAIRAGRAEDRQVALVFKDITGRKRAEEKLRQSQKIEAIGRLAGGIAHDFNNLLTAINGYSDILLETMGQDDPMRAFVQEIQGAGRKAATLTSQLLAYSRKQVLQPKVLDLNELVQESARLLRRVIGEDIEMELELGAGLLPIKADPSQMHQILLNLCLNARDAMPDGGRLRISTRNAPPGESTRDSTVESRTMVALEVSDTGIGMEPEVLERIFEPFFTTKGIGNNPAGRSGTGLGLSSVEGIVQQSGGRIEVRSAPGQGSTFLILLPGLELGHAAPDSDSPQAPARAAHGRGTILLVEDEEAVRKFVRSILEREGYTVMEARDGMEGKTLLESTGARPVLLLSDIVMPRMGGVQLARSVRKSHPDIPILLMSGYTEEDFSRQAEPDESFQVLQKPFTAQSLFQKVAELLKASGKA